MKGWKEDNIGNLVKVNERTRNRSFVHETIEYIDTSSVTEGVFDVPQIILTANAPSRAKRLVQENDIVVSTVRPNLKHFGFIQKPNPNTIASTGFAVISSKKIDAKFLYYFLASDFVTDYFSLISENQTSAYPSFNPELIKKLKILYPEKSINQQRIASILSAYDDLTEVNNQRIKLLEQTARELYKEWFVRMRFPATAGKPGYKKAKFKKGVPEGWKIGKIGNLYEIKSGFAFKGEMLGADGFPIIKITNIQNGNIDLDNCDRYSGELNKRIEKFELAEGNLLIAMTGAQIGKVGLVSALPERYFLNQRVGKFFPIKTFLSNSSFAFFTSNTEYFQTMIENFGMGAAQPNISGEQIERVNCIIPSDEILERFTSICEPIFKQTSILKTQNTQLRQIRDRLLPRLISGKLRVSEL